MSRLNARWRVWLALLLAVVLAIAPALAEARAGGGSSVGSRGARSYTPNRAQPLSRSAAPQPQTTPGLAPGSGYGGGSFLQRHPFLTGLAGGFIGSWLFSHAGWAGAGGYGHSGFGILFELLIIGLLIWFVFRLFRSRAFSGGGWPGAAMMAQPQPAGDGMRPGRDINVADADLAAFQQLHASIQEAWSRGDLGRMRQYMTPEMVGYFSEELTRNASQGVQNVVSGVQLENGELTEAWEEGDLQYASALMRWRAHDYLVRLDGGNGNTGQIVSGDPRALVEAEEMWTFVRRRGGNWLLSAIQQV